MAAWGSHNDQSHNHNDVGNFVVFADGQPVIVDAGRPTYTAQTFSIRRYEIWAMQSAFHNLPTINGQMQQAGRAVRSEGRRLHRDRRRGGVAHGPGAGVSRRQAGITSWLRTVRLARGRDVVVDDRFSLAQPSKDLTLSLMTPCEARNRRAAR